MSYCPGLSKVWEHKHLEGAQREADAYWCTDCRGYFSVKTGTVMQNSNLSLRKWVIAIYQVITNINQRGQQHEAP